MGPLAIALMSSYLIGSIPTAYLLVKRLKRVDIRTIGSGNVGATNVTRVAGRGAGAVVFLLDLAKGLVAVGVLAPWLVQPVTAAGQLGCGLAAVIGHIFPLFLKFRGGKGVATTMGVLLGVTPLVAAACMGVWACCVLLWRYVSVASLVAAVTIPITQALGHRSGGEIIVGVVLALLIVVKHRQNIDRLMHGTEHRWTRGS